MKISKEQVEKLADLVRLEISEEEKEKYAHDLTVILDYADRLDEADTSNVKLDKNEIVNIYDEDKAENCDTSQEELLKNAPEIKDGFIKVKQVLE